MESHSNLLSPKRSLIIRSAEITDSTKKENINFLSSHYPSLLLQVVNIEHRSISDDESLAKHYRDRVTSIYAGIIFLLNCYEINNDGCLDPYHLLRGITEKFNQFDKDKITDIAYYQNSLHHFVQHIGLMLKNILELDSVKEALTYLETAEQLAIAIKPRPIIATVVKINEDVAIMIDEPMGIMTDSLKKELTRIKKSNLENSHEKLPPWFLALNAHEKKMINYFLNQLDLNNDIQLHQLSLPSKIRLIPALSNYRKHTLIHRDKNKRTHVHQPIYASSHIASRDVRKKSQAVRDKHAKYNLLKVLRDTIDDKMRLIETEKNTITHSVTILISLQTLVSPIISPDKECDVDKRRAMRDPDVLALLNTKRTVNGQEIKFELVSTNHALNFGKYAHPTGLRGYSHQEIDQALSRLEADYCGVGLKKFVIDPNNQRLFEIITRELKKLTHASPHMYLNPYRELYLSSLEALMIELSGGISYGSCISGKDRKAVEIIHTDAIKIFVAKYNELPLFPGKFNKEDVHAVKRYKKFNRIFAELYCTKHQQALAALNTPGAFGIKGSDTYLPDHLQCAVNEWYNDHKSIKKNSHFKNNKYITSNNNIRKIKAIDLTESYTTAEVWTACDMKPTFETRMNVLWAKTYLSADEYSPPTASAPGGILNGQPIPMEYLYHEEFIFQKFDSPYTTKGRFKSFFGFPYKDKNHSLQRYEIIAFVIKCIPKTLLNSAKLVSEILPGTLVAGNETISHHLADAIANSTRNLSGRYVGLYLLYGLSLLTLALFHLLHFAGKATTSPMRNMRDAWQYFDSLRSSNNNYKKIAGYLLGGLAVLSSLAVTATVYALLAPVIATGAALLGGALGIAGAIHAGIMAVLSVMPHVHTITSAAVSAMHYCQSVIGPTVTKGLSQVLGKSMASELIAQPAIMAVGAITGIFIPVIAGPIAHWVNNKIRDVAKKISRFFQKKSTAGLENPIHKEFTNPTGFLTPVSSLTYGVFDEPKELVTKKMAPSESPVNQSKQEVHVVGQDDSRNKPSLS